MADNIKATWLKDKDGVKVAPATLTSQITDENGKGLDEILNKYINRPLDSAYIEDQMIVEQVNSLGIPSKWKYVESPCYIKKENVIPESGSSVWFSYNSMAGAAIYNFLNAPVLIEGQEYLIEIDDQYSFAVCKKDGYELGLKFLFLNNTYVVIDNYGTLMFHGGGSGYHTLSLWRVKSKKLLDKKLLDKAYLEAPSYGYTGDFLKLDYSGKPVWTSMDTYLQSYIYNDDYATSSSAGIVQPNTSYGTTMVNSRYIAISPASTSNISAKTDNYKPLTSKNIDYIVKEGLGDSALTWTETEKTKARNTIGIAQSDWNQNDSTKIDYIKNRTHYDKSIVYTLSQEIDYGGSIGSGDKNYTSIDERLHELLIEKDVNEILVEGHSITFYEEISNNDGHKFCYKINGEDYLYLYVSLLNKVAYVFNSNAFDGKYGTKTISYKYYDRDLKQLDEKFIPDSVKPSTYVIDSEAYTYGDDALQAILSGKQLYVKVPSSSENSPYGNFMPVLQYQLPQNGNNYLTLFYLKDGIAQNLLAALTAGSLDGVFGEITMMLSQSYDECPLKADPVK